MNSIKVLLNGVFRFITIYCVNQYASHIIFNIREEQPFLEGLNTNKLEYYCMSPCIFSGDFSGIVYCQYLLGKTILYHILLDCTSWSRVPFQHYRTEPGLFLHHKYLLRAFNWRTCQLWTGCPIESIPLGLLPHLV